MNLPLFAKVYVCEGCGKRQEEFIPLDWWQCGTSRLDPPSTPLALWCPTCHDDGTMSKEARGPS